MLQGLSLLKLRQKLLNSLLISKQGLGYWVTFINILYLIIYHAEFKIADEDVFLKNL